MDSQARDSIDYVLRCVMRGIYMHIGKQKAINARRELGELTRKAQMRNLHQPETKLLMEFINCIENERWSDLHRMLRNTQIVAAREEYEHLVKSANPYFENLPQAIRSRRQETVSDWIQSFKQDNNWVQSQAVYKVHKELGEKTEQVPQSHVQENLGGPDGGSGRATVHRFPILSKQGQKSDMRMAFPSLRTYSERKRDKLPPPPPVVHQLKENEIKDLAERLSKKLKTDSPTNSDDVHTSEKLVERFTELYENDWDDAFEEVTAARRFKTERETVENLLQVVKRAYDFCRATAESQLQQLTASVKDTMIYHNVADKKEYPTPRKLEEDKIADSVVREIVPNLRQVQKKTASISLPRLKVLFHEDVMEHIFKGLQFKTGENLKRYVEECVELIWLMSIKDPPIHFEYCSIGEVTPANFKPHLRTGYVVTMCVWPAVFLYKGGPLLSKGVVMMK